MILSTVQTRLRGLYQISRAETGLKVQSRNVGTKSELGSLVLDIRKNELRWSRENSTIFGLPAGKKLDYETFLNCVQPEDRAYVDLLKYFQGGLRGDGICCCWAQLP